MSASASRADAFGVELCRRSRNRGIAALQNVLDTESIMICFKQAHETLAWGQRQSQLRTCSETNPPPEPEPPSKQFGCNADRPHHNPSVARSAASTGFNVRQAATFQSGSET